MLSSPLGSISPWHYKMELIYVQTRLKGQDSLELALEQRKKERKTKNFHFYRQLVQAYTIVFVYVLGLDR